MTNKSDLEAAKEVVGRLASSFNDSTFYCLILTVLESNLSKIDALVFIEDVVPERIRMRIGEELIFFDKCHSAHDFDDFFASKLMGFLVRSADTKTMGLIERIFGKKTRNYILSALPVRTQIEICPESVTPQKLTSLTRKKYNSQIRNMLMSAAISTRNKTMCRDLLTKDSSNIANLKPEQINQLVLTPKELLYLLVSFVSAKSKDQQRLCIPSLEFLEELEVSVFGSLLSSTDRKTRILDQKYLVLKSWISMRKNEISQV